MKLSDLPQPFLATLRPRKTTGRQGASGDAMGQARGERSELTAADSPQLLVDGPAWAATEPMPLDPQRYPPVFKSPARLLPPAQQAQSKLLASAHPALEVAASVKLAPPTQQWLDPIAQAFSAAAQAQLRGEAPASSNALALPHSTPLLFEWQALALREADFDSAATVVLSALSQRLNAHRVSLLARSTDKLPARWLASSEGIDQDQRAPVQRQLLNAADEVLSREGAQECPWPAGVKAAPCVALAALVHSGQVPSAWGMAFDMPDGARAALIVELRVIPSDADRALARDAALFVGPVLMLKAQADASWLARIQHQLRPYDARQRKRRLPLPWLAGGGVALAVGVLALWPSTHHVVAQARIEGHGQRVVPAPMDGFLHSVKVRPGERVKSGQVLAQLDDKDALLQAERTVAERKQFERQYLDALTREDAAASEIARSKLEQARAADDLAQSRLSLSRLTAPFDGVVISGDLVSVVGSPVKRGQELMVVAPSQTWRVVAEVDENDIAHVVQGQNARMLLAGSSGATAEFAVARISPVAQAVEGRNVFEVEGLLAAADGSGIDSLRPGLRGIVRIQAGERAPAAVWWERASNAMRRALWSLMA